MAANQMYNPWAYSQYPNQAQAATPQFQSQAYMQKPVLPGRVITNIDEVTPSEVVMDGSVSLFLMKDCSCVYAKAWNSDGTIRTVKFVPEPEKVMPQEPDLSEKILSYLDRIIGLLSSKEKEMIDDV